MVRTNLFGHATGVQAWMIGVLGRFLLHDPEHGALSTLFAATKDLAGGSYVTPGGLAHMRGSPEIAVASEEARDATSARGLWDVSARVTGVDFAATV
jgi:hypothetical protein